MPIYEYKCTKGHVFEVKQSFSDEPLTKCQVCGAPVQKVLYPAAIHFKGSGFYNTDYKTSRRAREAKEHTESVSKAESGSGSSSDSGGGSGGSSKSEGGGSTSEGGGSKSDSSGTSKPKSAAA